MDLLGMKYTKMIFRIYSFFPLVLFVLQLLLLLFVSLYAIFNICADFVFFLRLLTYSLCMQCNFYAFFYSKVKITCKDWTLFFNLRLFWLKNKYRCLYSYCTMLPFSLSLGGWVGGFFFNSLNLSLKIGEFFCKPKRI